MTSMLGLLQDDGSALLGRNWKDVRDSVVEMVEDSMHELDMRETIAVAKLVDSRIEAIGGDLTADLRDLALRAITPIAPIAVDVADLDGVVASFCALMRNHGSLRSVLKTADAQMRFHLAMTAERERRPGYLTPAMLRIAQDHSLVEDGSANGDLAGDNASIRLIGPNVEIRYGMRHHHPEEMINYAVPIVARDDRGDREEAPEPNPMVTA